jgi:hypothetical protein
MEGFWKRLPYKTTDTSTSKRRRVSASPAAQPVKNERIAGVAFPSPILALPHVLERIDTLLMEPAEAVRAAVTTGQVKWLREIMSTYGNSVASADMLVVAASKGYETVVRHLLSVFSTAERRVYWKMILPAMVAAGEDGRVGVLKVLMEALKIETIQAYFDREEVRTEVEKAFGQAAGRGHLNVVTFLVQHLTERLHDPAFGKRSLSRAISGGHTDVIEFLLRVRVDGFDWDLPHAFTIAVDTKQTELAVQLYEGHPLYKGEDLFVCLARGGNTAAVEFLHQKLSSNVELLDAALLAAAENDKSDVAALLIATERISSDAVARSFVVAARHQSSFLVKYSLANYELSPETIGAAFVRAAEYDQFRLVQTLYDEHRVLAEAVLEAFNKTSWSSTQHTLEYLVELLSDESRILPEFKYKAFVSAAARRNTKSLQQFTKRGSAELPLEVLRDAHEATRDLAVRKFIYKVAYQQLFDPNVKGRFDAVATLMAEQKKEPTKKKSRAQRKAK